MIFGKIVSVDGPLPYSMTQCVQEIAAKSVELNYTFQQDDIKNDPKLTIDGKQVTRESIILVCLEREDRPNLDQVTK